MPLAVTVGAAVAMHPLRRLEEPQAEGEEGEEEQDSVELSADWHAQFDGV